MSRRNQSGNVRLIVILLVILAVIAGAYLIVTELKANDNSPIPSGTAESSTVFNTPVGKLIYPSDRAKYATIREKSEDDSYSSTLYGAAGKNEFQLFSVYVNKSVAESFVLGNITDSSGKTYTISIAIKDLEEDSGWSKASDEDKDLIYAMQEDVNYIVEQIEKLPGFVRVY